MPTITDPDEIAALEAKIGNAPTPGQKYGEVFTSPPKWVEFLRHDVLPAAGMTAGAMAGAASPVPGGSFIGAGAGNLAADEISRRIGQAYGMPVRGWTPATAAESFGTGVAAEAGGRALSAGLGGLVRAGGMAEAMTKAGEKAPEFAAAKGTLARKAEALEATASRKLAEKTEAAQSKVIADRGPAAAQMELQSYLGRTPETTAVLPARSALPEVTHPGLPIQPEHAERARSLARSFRGAWENGQKVYGKLYDELAKKNADVQIPTEPIHDAALNELTWNETKGVVLSGDVKKVLKDAVALHTKDSPLAAMVERSMISPATGMQKTGPTRVLPYEHLHGLWQRASALANKTFTGPQSRYNNRAMARLAQAIQDHTAKYIEVLRPLNDQYTVWKTLFDDKTLGNMRKMITPDMWAGLFAGPKLEGTLALFRMADANQRQVMQNALADVIVAKGWSAKQVGERLGVPALKAIFPGREIGRLEPWLQYEAKAAPWDALIKSDPVAARMVQSAMLGEKYAINQKLFTQLRAAGVSQLNKMGPTGEALARELTQLSPQEAAIRLGEHIKAGRLALPALKHDAQIEALRTLKPDPILKSIMWRSMWLGPIGVGLGLLGRTSPYIAGSAILGGALAPALVSRAMVRAMVRNPELADVVMREINKSPSQLGVRSVGRAVGRLLAADGAHHIEDALGLGPAAQPAPGAPQAQLQAPQPSPTAVPTKPPGAPWLSQAVQTPAPQAAAQELKRLNITLPTKRTVQFGGRALEMPPQVSQKFHALRDNLVQQELAMHLRNGAYQSASPETQRRSIELITKRMGRVAAKQMQMELAKYWKSTRTEAPEPPENAGP